MQKIIGSLLSVVYGRMGCLKLQILYFDFKHELLLPFSIDVQPPKLPTTWELYVDLKEGSNFCI